MTAQVTELNMESQAKVRLGHRGYMLYFSKCGYTEKYPKNLVAFNCNLFVDNKKIWYGDLDVTKNINSIKNLANDLGKTLYFLYEMDGRFENESNPDLSKAFLVVNGDSVTLGKGLEEYFTQQGDTVMLQKKRGRPKGSKNKRRSLWEESNFKLRLKLPNLSSFYTPAVNRSPLEYLALWVAAELSESEENSVKPTEISVQDIWLGDSDYNTLVSLTRKWIRKCVSGNDTQQTNKALNTALQLNGPSKLSGPWGLDPSWHEDGYVYLVYSGPSCLELDGSL